MAAALTYYTLFSLLPTMVLMLVVAHSFLTDAQREEFKQKIVNSVMEVMGDSGHDYAEKDQAESNETGKQGDQVPGGAASSDQTKPDASSTATASAPSDDKAASSANAAMSEAEKAKQDRAAAIAKAEEQRVADEISRREEFLMARDNLDEWVQGVYTQLENTSFGSIGIFGTFVFLYAATALLRSIENSFNSVYQTFSIRSIFVRLPIYYMVITLGPLIIIGGLYAQQVFFNMVEAAPWTAWLSGPLAFISPLIAIWLVFFVGYVLLPNASVHVRAAAVGSFVSALLWVIVISSFRLYVARYSYANLYGALALLPLFLLLLWISWLVVLFGLQITYTLQHLEGKRLERERKNQKDRFVDPGFVLPIMASVGKAFVKGETLTVEELSARLNLPGWAVTQMVQRLIQASLLHQTQDSEKAKAGLSLAQPPQQITVAQLLETAKEATLHSEQLDAQPGMSTYTQLRAAAIRQAGETTLVDVMDEDAKVAPSC